MCTLSHFAWSEKTKASALEQFANKFANHENSLIRERRNCDSLRTDLARVTKEHTKVRKDIDKLVALDDSKHNKQLQAQDRLDRLEQEAQHLSSSIAELKLLKMDLEKEVHIADQEREQLENAVSVAASDNAQLAATAKMLADKIDSANKQRLKFMKESEENKAEADGVAEELDEIASKMKKLKLSAFSSLAAGGAFSEEDQKALGI